MRRLAIIVFMLFVSAWGCSGGKIEVAVTSPSGGATISGNVITVTGTVKNTAETGVTVNGIPASLYADPTDVNRAITRKTPLQARFVVNAVPLVAGKNTLTIVATDVNGLTQTKTVEVTADIPEQFIMLEASCDTGVAPMEISLRIGGTVRPSTTSITYTGPGTVEAMTSDDPEEYHYKLNAPGIYHFNAMAQNAEGKTYSDTLIVTVLPLEQIHALLKSRWDKFTLALSDQDIDEASTHFASVSRDIYKQTYNNLKPILSDVTHELNSARINFISLNNRRATYEILVTREGTTASFQLEFIMDETGIWKIYKY